MDMDALEVEQLWQKSMEDDANARNLLKQYYMKSLLKIKPLYANMDDQSFNTALEDSVTKALDRGIKFKIKDYDSYMDLASQTYFKYYLLPATDTINIPAQLYHAFSRLNEIYELVPDLIEKPERAQIKLLTNGFEYPEFATRLLYFSFIKWKKGAIRQVDIDLTVALLPGPQRVEWEVFYEKSLEEIINTIKKEMDGK